MSRPTAVIRTVVTLIGLTLFAQSAAHAADPAGIKIALAGDSTVSNFAPQRPERGWGVFLGDYFDREVTIDNFAKPGRSTKTFLEEGRWAKVLASHPDYILIQFGHNDSHSPEHHEHTDPDGLYTELLTRFVNEARAAGATPVLVTPVQRRTKRDTLLPYVAAMKKVAAQTHTPLVDLHELSGELYARLGTSAQAILGATKTDTTHFNPAAARRIAGLVAPALVEVVPALKSHLVTPAK
ncbi:MAG TPA: rhamnogalacturonan acetylesterase [Opitutaceae bacterium]|nr:rhamnogalacturonan acetylesterase [Opitutaceae bacterium]